jgi:hypothetical protein
MILVTYYRATRLLLQGLPLVSLVLASLVEVGSRGTFGGVVFIGGFWDLEQGVDGELQNQLSRCEQAVDKAGAL